MVAGSRLERTRAESASMRSSSSAGRPVRRVRSALLCFGSEIVATTALRTARPPAAVASLATWRASCFASGFAAARGIISRIRGTCERPYAAAALARSALRVRCSAGVAKRPRYAQAKTAVFYAAIAYWQISLLGGPVWRLLTDPKGEEERVKNAVKGGIGTKQSGRGTSRFLSFRKSSPRRRRTPGP